MRSCDLPATGRGDFIIHFEIKESLNSAFGDLFVRLIRKRLLSINGINGQIELHLLLIELILPNLLELISLKYSEI